MLVAVWINTLKIIACKVSAPKKRKKKEVLEKVGLIFLKIRRILLITEENDRKIMATTYFGMRNSVYGAGPNILGQFLGNDQS